MARIVFLAHRIPYPPDKGDKIRSWHVLRHLARRHEVHLGAFIDDPLDWAHAPVLAGICASTCLRPLGRMRLGRRSLAALARGRALSLHAYHDARLAAWLDRRLKDGIDLAFAYSAASVLPLLACVTPPRTVLDLVDCDSAKWEARAATAGPLLRWLFAREARLVLAFERRAAAMADRTVLVSKAEAELFGQRSPGLTGRVSAIANGVDGAYFAPGSDHPDPYGAGPRPVLVFTGAMDYAPNIDAVTWFVREVMPRLTFHVAPLFAIVGTRPDRAVQSLAGDSVIVTGRVADVRPYLQHATLAVAPLLLARGLQNKVLEAMAMSRAVVATGAAREGLTAEPGRDLVVADGAGDFAAAIDELLARPERRRALGEAARAFVLAEHDWTAQLDRLDAIIDELAPACG